MTKQTEALNAPLAKQEPVAWAWRAFDPDDGQHGKWGIWKIADYKPPRQSSKWFQVVPLPCTTPQPAQRKPLTDEAIVKITSDPCLYIRGGDYRIDIARAIEAAHGIKENT
jgi:hypothetical protein